MKISYQQFHISDSCSVFQAELFRLNLAVKRILHFPGAKILISSDSLSSLFALVNFRNYEKFVDEIQNTISTSNGYNINLDFACEDNLAILEMRELMT